MVAGMSRSEIRNMPPFPFPERLFPPGTFPPVRIHRAARRVRKHAMLAALLLAASVAMCSRNKLHCVACCARG